MNEDMDLWLPSKTAGTQLDPHLAKAEAFLLKNDFAVCHSKAMKEIYANVVKYAKSKQPVLLLGPTGSGKEIIAEMIHSLSDATDSPFLDLNCGSFSDPLVESQLFGHRKGAFTGASDDKTGFFDDVGAGCIFLDEIGELPLALQPRLLRVLENRNFRPLGSTAKRSFLGRVVAATNRDIEHMVEDGLFREDLIHRLNTFTIEVPPLRKHMEDIPILARHFLAREKSPLRFDRDALSLLFQHDWPGNIRELKNAMDRLMVICEEPIITPSVLETAICGKSRFTPVDEAMEEVAERLMQLDLGNRFNAIEHCLVDYAIRKADGNKAKAARMLGVHRKSVERRLNSLSSLVQKVEQEMESGKNAMRENCYESAATSYHNALDTLRELPMKTEYSNLRFEALSKLSICQRNQEGWADDSVLEAYDEALQLGKSLGRERELVSVTFGLWTTRLMALQLAPAKHMAGELLAQGEKLNSSQYRIQAHLAIANTDFWLGNFSGVFTSLSSFYAIYEYHQDMLMDYGMDPFALCVMFDGLTAFQVGQFNRARKAISRGLERADEISHPFSLAISLQAACWLEWLFENKEATREHAENLISLSSKNGFTFYLGLGEVFLGRLMVEDGDVDEGLEMIQQGYLDRMVHSGGKLFHSFYSLLLAQALIVDNQLDAAQETLEEAMDLAQSMNEMCYLSEMICLRGTVHALRGEQELANAEYHRAAHTALPLQSQFAHVKALYELAKQAVGTELEKSALARLTPELKKFDNPDRHPLLVEIQKFLKSSLSESKREYAGTVDTF